MKMNSNDSDDKPNFIKGVSEINNEVQLILDCDSLVKIVEDIDYALNR